MERFNLEELLQLIDDKKYFVLHAPRQTGKTSGLLAKEAGPQLLLQRIVNSGGRVHREYGLGRKRTDLMLIWFYSEKVQKVVIELKILYKSLEKTIDEGLKQTWEFI
ncbi:Uncharacterized protein dnl_44760 [Desulfonema limicola]|uniref:Uncharacterized protein n=1 Tax=Desulfonema limicola TaxID=45656 RepID=A0A975BAT9_9BACT|nr:hypothetical protein [Desulfonema limicola]QTA82111.1 Uncharacterized protein dnl_44760 [Desulfonema limicola]